MDIRINLISLNVRFFYKLGFIFFLNCEHFLFVYIVKQKKSARIL